MLMPSGAGVIASLTAPIALSHPLARVAPSQYTNAVVVPRYHGRMQVLAEVDGNHLNARLPAYERACYSM
jgi:hypothetical protein